MYSVAVKREFVAQHFLIGGDWGAENDWHSHHYQVEECNCRAPPWTSMAIWWISSISTPIWKPWSPLSR